MAVNLYDLRAVGVAVVCQASGAVVDCNARFRELVQSGAAEATGPSERLPVWLDTEDIAPRAGETTRYVEKRRGAATARPSVGVTVSRCAEEGFLQLEVVDVTAQTAAEEQFTWILESSFDGFWDWHIKDDYEYMSPQFWRMFGYEPHEKEHKPSAWQDMINQDDLKKALANLAKHVETRGEHPYLQEVRYTHKDGSTVWVLCKGRVVEYDDQGGAVRMVGTHTDITKLKEEQLKQRELVKVVEEQNAELKRLANAMRDFIYGANVPMIGFDDEGRITEWNACVARLVGANETAMIGEPLATTKICAPHCLDRVKRAMSGACPLNNTNLSLRIHFPDSKGTVELLANSTTRIHTNTGKPAGGYILGQDLTEVVVAKKDAIQLASEARAERNLNEYISHEVRNPVFSAQAAAEFLCDFFALPEVAAIPAARAAAEDAMLVAKSLDYVAELLSSLLDLNKFLEGLLPYTTSEVELEEEVLTPVLAMLRRRCAPGVILSAECPPGLVGQCDATRVKQVVMNLTANALKYTSYGFVRVVASVHAASGDLELRVEDSGVGVPPKSADKLFDRFAHAANHDQGSGIGLYLSRLVVEKIGGKLWLDQSYDSGVPGSPGSCFRLRLPFQHLDDVATSDDNLQQGQQHDEQHQHQQNQQNAKEKAAEEVAAGEENESKSDLTVAPLRLLLVDDDLLVRKVLARLVHQALPEVVVEQAANGEAALELVCAGSEYDVIIMDQHMGMSGGKMEGTEAIRALRNKGVESLIVGFSGNDIDGEFAAAGADFSWRKPMLCKTRLRTEILAGLRARRGEGVPAPS